MEKPGKSEAIQRLQVALEKVPDLQRLERDSPIFEKWKRDTRVAIENVFGTRLDHVREFTKIRYFPAVVTTATSDYELQKHYIIALDRAAVLLESMIEEIQAYWPNDGQDTASARDLQGERPNTNEVFLIHGRNESTKQMVARFLEQMTLKPLILSEQPNQGLTIIEKFEKYSQVNFAIALLTPDDIGSLDGEEKINLRARQNVIFELGYFIGRLGRQGVCALIKGKMEIPSDYSGIVYINFDDAEAWKMSLFRELKTVGFDVDANLAF